MYDLGDPYDLGVVRIAPPAHSGNVIYTSSNSGVSIAGNSSGIAIPATYCVSGAVGTPNCNLISRGQFREWTDRFGRGVYLIAVQSTNGQPIFCHGDSGGPIYFVNPSGQYIAAGIVSTAYDSDPRQQPVVPAGACGTWGGISVVSTAMSKVNGLVMD